jgi:hypothetical protein
VILKKKHRSIFLLQNSGWPKDWKVMKMNECKTVQGVSLAVSEAVKQLKIENLIILIFLLHWHLSPEIFQKQVLKYHAYHHPSKVQGFTRPLKLKNQYEKRGDKCRMHVANFTNHPSDDFWQNQW